MRRRQIRFTDHPVIPFEEWTENGIDSEQLSTPGQAGYTDLELGDADRKLNHSTDNHLNYISFGSGSSGNSCYIGTSKGGVIIDAGVKTEDMVATLNANGVSMKQVHALLLTHDHSDHVRYAYTLVRNYKHIRLFCTNRVLNGLLRRHNISRRIKEYHTPIFKEIPVKIGELEITAFEVPHDGTDNMGFSIVFRDKRFVLATDLGAITDRARHYMSQANYLVIEANYDLPMLLNGRYPEYLKARIQTQFGHMQNEHTAAFLAEIINPELRYVFLCHLSQDNNTPAKAVKAVRDTLEQMGKRVGNAAETIFDRHADIQLMALPRFTPTRWFVFR